MARSNYFSQIANRSNPRQAILRPPHRVWPGDIGDLQSFQPQSHEASAMTHAASATPQEAAAPAMLPYETGAAIRVADLHRRPPASPMETSQGKAHSVREPEPPMRANAPAEALSSFDRQTKSANAPAQSRPALAPPATQPITSPIGARRMESAGAPLQPAATASNVQLSAAPETPAALPKPAPRAAGPTPFLPAALATALQRLRTETEEQFVLPEPAAPLTILKAQRGALTAAHAKQTPPDAPRMLPKPAAPRGETHTDLKGQLSVHIGSIDVQIVSPHPTLAQPAPAAPIPDANRSLARGFINYYGFRQR